jgi:hypothetical protein
LLDAAEFDPSVTPRFVQAHTCEEIFLNVHLDMGFHFLGEVSLASFTAK